MHKTLQRIVQYFSAILRQIVIIFGGTIGVIFYLATVYSNRFSDAERLLLVPYFLLLYLIASYQVWRSEREQKESLMLQLENPVDYELTVGNLEKIDFPLVKETYDIANDEIQRANDLIKQWHEWERITTADHYKELLTRETIPTPDDCKTFLDSVDGYKRELTRFEQQVQDCYTIDFFIKNIGSTVDEDISVHVTMIDDGDNSDFHFYEHIEKLCPIPRKPELGNWADLSRSRRMADLLLWDMRDSDPPPERWKSQLILSNTVISEIDNLKAGTGCSMLFNGTVIKTTRKKVSFEYWVATNKTKKPIKKSFILDLETAIKWGTPIEERKERNYIIPNKDK